LALKLEAIWF